MKQFLCLLLAFVMLVGLMGGCASDSPAPTDTTGTEATEPSTKETTLSTEPSTEPTIDPILETLRNSLPLMDGSTSLIPLEAGIRAAIFGKTIEEATADVVHSSTWESFYNLLDGSVDLIFSCPLSEEQQAQDQIQLEMSAVAKEGFVFVVNAKNPVNTLTQQQIKDIYSGKITNWSQVGGLDEEIIPYQRNRDSGSQNYMLEFMGNTPLMDAPTELRPASMEGLMDVIAVNDNARGAIGYSVYAYAADMYGNGNEIKFIQVDGVAPGKKTFSNGTYPLMGYNYAIFNAAEPADSNVRALVDWMLSFDGQTAIAKAGYVTVRDIGFNYEEMTFSKYSGIGTGSASSIPSSYENVAYTTLFAEWGPYCLPRLMPEAVTLTDGIKSYRVTQIADPALREEINNFIDTQMRYFAGERHKMLTLVDRLAGDAEYPIYTADPVWPDGIAGEDGTPAECLITCTNGYLSVAVALTYSYNVMEGQARFYEVQTATWDLITGKRLAPEELFCWGVDVDQVLNDYLRSFSQSPVNTWGDYPDMKQDFAALTTTGWHITHDTLYIDHNNPWFAYGIEIPLNNLPDGTLVAETPRDFADRLSGTQTEMRQQFRISKRDIYYAYNADNLLSCGFLKESAHPNAEKVNRQVMEYLNTYYTADSIRAYFDSINIDSSKVYLGMLDWYLQNWGGKYLLFQGTAPYYYPEGESYSYVYPYPAFLLFDLETGEQIPWTDLLSGDWLADSKMEISYPSTIIEPFYEGLSVSWLYLDEWGNLFVYLEDENMSYYLTVPEKYIRYE